MMSESNHAHVHGFDTDESDSESSHAANQSKSPRNSNRSSTFSSSNSNINIKSNSNSNGNNSSINMIMGNHQAAATRRRKHVVDSILPSLHTPTHTYTHTPTPTHTHTPTNTHIHSPPRFQSSRNGSTHAHDLKIRASASTRTRNTPQIHAMSKLDRSRSRTRTRTRTHSKRRWGKMRSILYIVGAIIIILYGAVFMRLKYLLRRDGQKILNDNPSSGNTYQHQHQHSHSNEHEHSGSYRPPMQQQQQQHHQQQHQQQQSDTIKSMLNYMASEKAAMETIRQRQEQRRQRTRPTRTPYNNINEKLFKSYRFEFLQEHYNDETIKTETMGERDRNRKHNTHHHRCGIYAQEGFDSNPSSFPHDHSIHKTSESTVLITGILNRLGFHLALKLATECNVQVLIGVDTFYPNESKHKLQLLQKLSVLYSKHLNMNPARTGSGTGSDSGTRTRTGNGNGNGMSTFKVPLIHVFDGVNPRRTRNLLEFMDGESGDFDYHSFANPTHVVHLLSAEEHSYMTSDDGVGDGDRYGDSDSIGGDTPYKPDDGMFRLRQSLLATDQLLNNLGDTDTSRLHFTFASDLDVLKLDEVKVNGNGNVPGVFEKGDNGNGNTKKSRRRRRGMFTTTKFMEEVLFQSYASSARLKDTTFVTLRFPKLYGPWGDPNSFDYRLAQGAVAHWHDQGIAERELDSESMLLQLTGRSEQSDSHHEHNILFVDDAVDAIVAAMQYRNPNSNSAAFNIISGEKATTSIFADLLESYMPIPHHGKNRPYKEVTYDANGHYAPPQIALKAKDELHWAPKVSLKDGVKILLGWHLDEHLPFGRSSQSLSGDDSILSATETGRSFLVREGGALCDTNDSYCLRGRSVFPCSSECSDPASCIQSPSFDKASKVSKQLTEKCDIVLYTDNLEEDMSNITVNAPSGGSDSGSGGGESICSIAFILKSSRFAKDSLGDSIEQTDTFSHFGWNVVVIDALEDDISWELDYIFKMSPGKFFHSSVKSALYIPVNFSTDPEADDIVFTTDLLRRPTELFTAYKALNGMAKMKYEVGKSGREALIVMPGALTVEKSVDAVYSGSASTVAKKITLDLALKTLLNQRTNSEESKRHVHFERGVNSFFYNSHDFENPDAASFKFQHQGWTRNHWVAHNMEKDEARNLRCEWYREHTKWGDNNADLSFAHIMARLSIDRFNDLLDDEVKAAMQEEQKSDDIMMQTDSYQWHEYFDRDTKDPVYARIVDDRALIIERRLWNKVAYLKKPTS